MRLRHSTPGINGIPEEREPPVVTVAAFIRQSVGVFHPRITAFIPHWEKTFVI